MFVCSEKGARVILHNICETANAFFISGSMKADATLLRSVLSEPISHAIIIIFTIKLINNIPLIP